MRLILASTSPYRAQQLRSIGLDFTASAPMVDEDHWKSKEPRPEQLAPLLAKLKAESLADQFPKDLILGGDQVVSLSGTLLGKPKTLERAFEQLTLMQGREHLLITSIHLHGPGISHSHTETARMKMRVMTETERSVYLRFASPFDCAGSYKIELGGLSLFSEIQCQDWSSIQGVPLLALSSCLREIGKNHRLSMGPLFSKEIS